MLRQKWTIARQWEAHKAREPDLKGIVTDEKRFQNYLRLRHSLDAGLLWAGGPEHAAKAPAENIQMLWSVCRTD